LPALMRKFHLAKLATEQNWQAIEADAGLYGPIAPDMRSDLQALAASRGETAAAGHSSAGVTLWGSGRPLREFLHVDDLADACVFLMGLPDRDFAAILESAAGDTVTPGTENHEPVSHINVGSGEDHTIAELAQVVQEIVGFQGSAIWDRGRPDGTPRKLLDSSRLRALGWQPRIELREGIRTTYEAYRQKLEGAIAGCVR
jgi:GDP-L-fucose synthase